MSNHGKIGNPLYLKFTPEKFKVKTGDLYEHGYIVSIEEFKEKYGLASVPMHIDRDTKGEYECVCEFGTEIYGNLSYS